jgi:hypothetical protein
MTLAAFSPPAKLTDFSPKQAAAWSDFLSNVFDDRAEGNPPDPLDSPRDQFFNPVGVDLAADNVTKAITWSAFPKRIALKFPAGATRWREADRSRDVQDEYCEWSVERDAQGKVKRVTFTCEGPEYWQFLANSDPVLALSLYQKHISPTVRQEDLFTSAGKYITRNKWNSSTTSGAMHLVQANNTLQAEIELAAAATIIRERSGTILTTEQDLIQCSFYGDKDRHSDPHIGGEVNAIAREKALVTLADPVGLYMDGLSTAGWETPDGADAGDFWHVTRGTDGFTVRAVYEVVGHSYLVGDIKINGKQIQFGSQIAENITMRLTGLAHQFGKAAGKPRGCLGASVAAASAARGIAKLDVASLIGEPPARRR